MPVAVGRVDADAIAILTDRLTVTCPQVGAAGLVECALAATLAATLTAALAAALAVPLATATLATTFAAATAVATAVASYQPPRATGAATASDGSGWRRPPVRGRRWGLLRGAR